MATNVGKLIQKFENACTFLGIADKDKCFALLLTAGDDLSSLCETLEVVPTGLDDMKVWADHNKSVTDYFSDKKNLTASRWEFLNKKMQTNESTKDFCTRLNQEATDCEWDKMTNKEAIKLTVCLHKKIDKLRDEILVNDIKYENMIAKATSLEQAATDKKFMKKSMDSPNAENDSFDSLGRINRRLGRWFIQPAKTKADNYVIDGTKL